MELEKQKLQQLNLGHQAVKATHNTGAAICMQGGGAS